MMNRLNSATFFPLFLSSIGLSVLTGLPASAESMYLPSDATDPVKMSAEGMQILCERSPLNSRCSGMQAAPVPSQRSIENLDQPSSKISPAEDLPSGTPSGTPNRTPMKMPGDMPSGMPSDMPSGIPSDSVAPPAEEGIRVKPQMDAPQPGIIPSEKPNNSPAEASPTEGKLPSIEEGVRVEPQTDSPQPLSPSGSNEPAKISPGDLSLPSSK
jgi:hypothetical protein